MAEMIFATFSVIENSESANKNIWSLCKRPYVTVQKYVLLFKRPNKTGYFYYEKSPPLQEMCCKLTIYAWRLTDRFCKMSYESLLTANRKFSN